LWGSLAIVGCDDRRGECIVTKPNRNKSRRSSAPVRRRKSIAQRRTFGDAGAQSDCDCLATLGQFAAHVVHDVNNPLGTALASAQLALRMVREQDSPRLTLCLERAVASIRQASQLVKRLEVLVLEPPVEQATFDPHDAVQAAQSLTANYAKCCGCRIRVRREGAAALASGDAMQLTLALVGLICRAIQAGAETIAVVQKSSVGTFVVRVSDDAPNASHTPHSNDPIQTIPSYTDAACELSLAGKIIRRLGGRLDITPRRNRGTSIRIHLPNVLDERKLHCKQ
jgi:C4-dicarboxylate-specific signal transduction histidine kinase